MMACIRPTRNTGWKTITPVSEPSQIFWRSTGKRPGTNLPTQVQDSRSSSESVVRSAGIVSIAVLTSRITGLIREIVMARVFGAGFTYDAFLLGFRIPNLTRDLFAEGALSSAFVPIFTQTLATKGKREAAVLSNLVGTALIILVGTFCALGVIFSPALVNLLAEGFHQVPGKFELAVRMTRIMFPFLLLVALAAQAMGVLNACNFAVPALASTFFNIGSVVFGCVGFVLGPWSAHATDHGNGNRAWCWAALCNWSGSFQPGARDSVSVPLSTPLIRGCERSFALMGPAILGNAAIQINVMVNTNFASRIPGAKWSGELAELRISLHAITSGPLWRSDRIRDAALDSRSAEAGNMEEFRRTLSRSLGMVFLLTMPSSIGLVVLGTDDRSHVSRREISSLRYPQTALALSCYAIGLAGYSALKVLNPAFYALHDAVRRCW